MTGEQRYAEVVDEARQLVDLHLNGRHGGCPDCKACLAASLAALLALDEETREALDAVEESARHIFMDADERQGALWALGCVRERLAALPPVAAPEVRPDETLRALSEAATPGPWAVPVANVFRVIAPEAIHTNQPQGLTPPYPWCIVANVGDETTGPADAAFINAVVNAVRAWLAAPTDQGADRG